MNGYHRSVSWTAGLVTCCLLASNVAVAATDAASLAGDILKRTGVQGGMVVHVGCGDGKLTAALHASDRYTVHGLDADSENVANARRHIQSLGIYGSVSVEQHTGDVLPYADNLINLVVVQDTQMVSMKEVMRVLVPEGVAYVKSRRWLEEDREASTEQYRPVVTLSARRRQQRRRQ